MKVAITLKVAILFLEYLVLVCAEGNDHDIISWRNDCKTIVGKFLALFNTDDPKRHFCRQPGLKSLGVMYLDEVRNCGFKEAYKHGEQLIQDLCQFGTCKQVTCLKDSKSQGYYEGQKSGAPITRYDCEDCRCLSMQFANGTIAATNTRVLEYFCFDAGCGRAGSTCNI